MLQLFVTVRCDIIMITILKSRTMAANKSQSQFEMSAPSFFLVWPSSRQLCIKINFPAPQYNGHHANGQLVDIEAAAGVRERGRGGVKGIGRGCVEITAAGFELFCAGLKSVRETVRRVSLHVCIEVV